MKKFCNFDRFETLWMLSTFTFFNFSIFFKTKLYFFNITIAHVVCTENSQNKAHNHSNIWYTFNFAMLNSFVLYIFFSVFCHSILYMFFMLIKKFKTECLFLNKRILIKRSLNTHCFRSMYVRLSNLLISQSGLTSNP